MLARVQAGEAVAPAWKEHAPLFRDFAARYRRRRRSRWKPSSPGLQTRRGGGRGAAEAPPLPRPRQDLTAPQTRLAPGPWSKVERRA